ncbi:hypothetical protein [Vibrio coralliilyticus]|uniref:hypothetical protein n=1 Tax=Vibrio coralliilyticus TaxID=190893 RepID=UPI001561AB8E|nr:hypothetical protein [Vibrio coralliilyticus]NRF32982.1 hypothetical protein [Vibrio coralliilyticus]NRF55512.1 hypothetical protein [Vibrio coralliilyticus]
MSSKKDFEKFLNDHVKEEEENKINWELQKQEWLEYIDAFYHQIEEWFEPYVANKLVQYVYIDTELVESHIGSYKTRKMKIDFAGQSLVMEPIGTLLIGSKGRIDMEGARGRVQFVLADKSHKSLRILARGSKEQQSAKQIEWVWKIATRDAKSITFLEFKETHFFDALMEIINV